MILWTIQSYEVWQNMQEVGYLRGNAAQVEEDWISCYQWMIEQMRLRIKQSHDNAILILSGHGISGEVISRKSQIYDLQLF